MKRVVTRERAAPEAAQTMMKRLRDSAKEAKSGGVRTRPDGRRPLEEEEDSLVEEEASMQMPHEKVVSTYA